MTLKLRSNTLFIIPCSGKKNSTKKTSGKYDDPLRKFVSPEIYRNILPSREYILRKIQKYSSNKQSKNKNIKLGPDFGSNDLSGKYLPAIDRYNGFLYTAKENLSDIIKNDIDNPDKPRIIILSALYGPLHPLSMIQDYELKMSDKYACKTWKEHFPDFLSDYTQHNNIKRIHLYLGSSTAYYKIAKKAIQPLKKEGLLNQAVQFEVEDGNSYHTPANHGHLVTAHLQNKSVSGLTKNITINYL